MEANEAPAASRRSCNPRTKYGVYHILCKSQGIREDGLDVPAAAKSLQSCPTLCDPIDGLLPGSSVPGILQARTLKWVAISFSNA